LAKTDKQKELNQFIEIKLLDMSLIDKIFSLYRVGRMTRRIDMFLVSND